MLKQAIKKVMITGGLEVSAALSAMKVMREARGLGAIFTLHNVRPYAPGAINPNRHLEITPEFLDRAITRLKADGYRFVRLDEVPAILIRGDHSAPFAVFTLDDGYRDNRDHALPVFQRHGVPFTIFVCKGFSQRSHSMWWLTAEAMANGDQTIVFNGRKLKVGSRGQRSRAFRILSDSIGSGDETASVARLDEAARAAGIDPLTIPGDLVMDELELKAIAAHPLVTLGAHTVSHRAMGRLNATELARELDESAAYVEHLTGTRPTTFAYPYGDQRSVTTETARAVANAGLSVGVTTLPGTLKMANAGSPAALPRISINGLYQRARHVGALASGIPFRLMG